MLTISDYFDYIIYELKVFISANCKSPGTLLDGTVSQLQAVHGDDVTYRCPRKHAKKDLNVKATCQDGQITFSTGSSSCSKIGTKYDFNLVIIN